MAGSESEEISKADATSRLNRVHLVMAVHSMLCVACMLKVRSVCLPRLSDPSHLIRLKYEAFERAPIGGR